VNHKLYFRERAQSKCGSLDYFDHIAGGGDKKVFCNAPLLLLLDLYFPLKTCQKAILRLFLAFSPRLVDSIKCYPLSSTVSRRFQVYHTGRPRLVSKLVSK